MTYQLRLCPRGVPTEDYPDVEGPIPRVDEKIVAPDGLPFYVTHVQYTFEAGFDQPPAVFVVARWRRDSDAQMDTASGSLSSSLLTALREQGQDALADTVESGTPFDQWPTAMQVEFDKLIYGTAFTLSGERIDPTKVSIHRRSEFRRSD